jgi:hypothetical protein
VEKASGKECELIKKDQYQTKGLWKNKHFGLLMTNITKNALIDTQIEFTGVINMRISGVKSGNKVRSDI